MKVLFIANNAGGNTTLMLEREISELQRQIHSATGDDISFEFYPRQKVEELPLLLAKVRPDVLHISAHGDRKELALADSLGRNVFLTSQMLAALLDPRKPPTVVFLNACNSQQIAKELSTIVPVTIGTTNSIMNVAAVASAVVFYARLISGLSVHDAFLASKTMVEALHAKATSSEIYCRRGIDLEKLQIYQVPKIVARLRKGRKWPDSAGDCEVELGLIGSRRDTTQVVFFTDDETYSIEDELEDNMCLVARTAAVRGVIWSDFPWWRADGDTRLYACASTSSGTSYSASSTLCEALQACSRYFDDQEPDELPRSTQLVIQHLQSRDGSDLTKGKKRKRKPKVTAKGRKPSQKRSEG